MDLPSALSANRFIAEIESDLRIGIKHFVIAGFLLEHCVLATALELADKLADTGGRLLVSSDLSASL